MNDQVIKQEQPKNHLAWAIVSVVLCFPFGIPAILNATKVYPLWKDGHYEEALQASRKAKRWAIIGVVCNAVFYTLYILFIAAAVIVTIHNTGNIDDTDEDDIPAVEECWDDETGGDHLFI